MESAATDAEEAGGFGAVAGGFGEGLGDEFRFELGEGHASEGEGATGGGFAGEEGREMGRLDDGGGSGEDETLDDIAQLADVAGPREGLEGAHGLGAELFGLPGVPGGEVAAEHFRKRRDVLGAVAQRREVDGDDIEAVEEILTEGALGALGFQFLVRGGDNAGICADNGFAADGAEVAVLEDAEEIGLAETREVANLVQEESAIASEFEAAGLL